MTDDLRCPLCYEIIHQKIALKNNENMANWYICRCMYMFHVESHQPKDYFNEEYKNNFENLKKVEERQKYYVKCFGQIIEEKTYGRRFLDVGFCSPFVLKEMERRGWLTCGIDIIPNQYITGDFFTEKFEGEKFDCIWLSDFLQSTKSPIQAIYKSYRLLNPNGILFIVTPNTDLLKRDITSMWGHWDMTTNYSFINEKILKESFIKCSKSFNSRIEILYADWSNQSNRFTSWNNMHIIAQKTHIIDNPLFDKDIENVRMEKDNRINEDKPQDVDDVLRKN